MCSNTLRENKEFYIFKNTHIRILSFESNCIYQIKLHIIQEIPIEYYNIYCRLTQEIK